MRKTSRVLLVSENETYARISRFLPASDFFVTPAANRDELQSHLSSTRFDLCLINGHFEDDPPVRLLDLIHRLAVRLPVAVLCENPTVDQTVELVRHGAADILVDHPSSLNEIGSRLKELIQRSQIGKPGKNLIPAIDLSTVEGVSERYTKEVSLKTSTARLVYLFENAPVVITEQDLSAIKVYLENLHLDPGINFQEYLQNHPDLVGECLDLMRIRDINKAGLAFFRASSKRQMLKASRQIIKPENLSIFSQLLVHLLHGDHQFSIDGVLYTLDGEPRDVSLKGFAAGSSTSDLASTIVTVTDLTEPNRAMRELVFSEERFRAIVEQSPEGIVAIAPEGTIRDWNQGMERMSGLSRVEAVGKLVWEVHYQLLVSDSREKTTLEEEKLRVETFLSGETSLSGKLIEHPIQQPNGTIRSLQSIFFPIQLGTEHLTVSISRDITDVHDARSDLDLTQERFRLISENTSDLILLFDPNGTISYASPSFKHTLQYDPEDLLGQTVFSIIHPDDIDLVRTYYYPRLLQGDELERIDYRARCKDGRYVWLETGAQTINNGNGEIELIVASSRDVTERKITEHELQSAQIQLAHRIAELEIRTQELNLLTEMTNMLQICSDPMEAVSVFSQYASDLFPGVSGILYTQSEDESKMIGGAFWGNYSGEKEINHKDCWGLRRGRVHVTQDTQPNLYCRHTGFPPPSSSICSPVMSSGQAIGLLSLQTAPDAPGLTDAQRKLVAATSEQIGLALSNLNLRQNLREMAIRDSLTGLYNRHFLEETLETELNRAQRSGKPIGLIMLDLDHFKELNSVYGHPNVDQMLREFGVMLKRSIRSGDIACRYGGDEFLLILPETSLAIAEQRAEQIRTQVKALVIQGENLEPRTASASIGVACWPQHGKTSLRLLNIVDAALFKAKESGGDRVVLAE